MSIGGFGSGAGVEKSGVCRWSGGRDADSGGQGGGKGGDDIDDVKLTLKPNLAPFSDRYSCFQAQPLAQSFAGRKSNFLSAIFLRDGGHWVISKIASFLIYI
jgi:hypothetical protein